MHKAYDLVAQPCCLEWYKRGTLTPPVPSTKTPVEVYYGVCDAGSGGGESADDDDCNCEDVPPQATDGSKSAVRVHAVEGTAGAEEHAYTVLNADRGSAFGDWNSSTFDDVNGNVCDD